MCSHDRAAHLTYRTLEAASQKIARISRMSLLLQYLQYSSIHDALDEHSDRVEEALTLFLVSSIPVGSLKNTGHHQPTTMITDATSRSGDNECHRAQIIRCSSGRSTSFLASHVSCLLLTSMIKLRRVCRHELQLLGRYKETGWELVRVTGLKYLGKRYSPVSCAVSGRMTGFVHVVLNLPITHFRNSKVSTLPIQNYSATLLTRSSSGHLTFTRHFGLPQISGFIESSQFSMLLFQCR
jgi:hypothetical protein